MGVTRPVDTVIARETPVTQLPGYVLRRAHVGEHEAGLLLDKGHAERVCATPGTHRVLVLDDLVPGILLDRRSFARVRASPFTVTLDHNGLPTADNECVLLQATLTVAVVDAARFVQTFGASATASQVAERLVEETWDRLQAKVLGYSQQDLCHSRQLAQEMAGFLTGPEGCLRHLETWGLRCVGITPVVCLPKRKLEAVLERLGEALAQRGILSPDEMDDLLEDLPEGEDAKRALAEVMDEFLEEQEDSSANGLPPTKDSPLPLLVPLVLAALGATGGVAAQGHDLVQRYLAGTPLLGPYVGPVGGVVAGAMVATVPKWVISRFKGKRAEAKRMDKEERVRAQERAAWAQVQAGRAQSDLYAAQTDLSRWIGGVGRDATLGPMLRESEQEVGGALATLGTGLLGAPPGGRYAPREALLATRFFIAARALPRLTRMAVHGDADPYQTAQAVSALSRRAAAAAKGWQEYRVNLEGQPAARA